jgi:uncharacterized protein
MKVSKTVIVYALRLYKSLISPTFLPACRFVPTCSEYAVEAVECYGALHGSRMAIWRLLRCHPFTSGGHDPVMMRRDSETMCESSATIGSCRH